MREHTSHLHSDTHIPLAGLTVQIPEGHEEYKERATEIAKRGGPWRWMPPEAIMLGQWSHKSDGE